MPSRPRSRHNGLYAPRVTPLPSIPADLVTPLGAYLRLRGERGGSFLLESVERGRLGRNSFVGWGSRVVSFEEAETLGAPVVGYLAYDYASTLEPTVPLPADWTRSAGESLRRGRDARPLRSRCGCRRGAGRGCRRHRGAARASARDPRARVVSGAGRARALPDAGPVRGDGAPVPDAHRGGRRVPDRAVAARDATDACRAARAVPGAAARQPVAVPLPARAGRARPRGLVARATRRAARTGARTSRPSRARPQREKATSSGSSHPRRTARST